MTKHTHSRYQRLVTTFAASAFLLLSLLALKQQEANTVTGSVIEQPLVLTTYRP